jgi:hypothetical protein
VPTQKPSSAGTDSTVTPEARAGSPACAPRAASGDPDDGSTGEPPAVKTPLPLLSPEPVGAWAVPVSDVAPAPAEVWSPLEGTVVEADPVDVTSPVAPLDDWGSGPEQRDASKETSNSASSPSSSHSHHGLLRWWSGPTA